MAGTARSNHPGERSLLVDLNGLPPVGSNVQRLQRKLWAAAKQSPERRFHALYDRICRGDVLMEGWKRVRANKGAAGVDKVTLADVESYGVDRMLRELRQDLQAGSYRPAPARRVDIPKPAGGVRPLGIPTVRDRVAQAAAKVVLEPIFEADFLACSYGYRPKRSATDAKEAIRTAFPKGYGWAVEFDIADFFGSIDHDVVMGLVARRVSDRRVLKLIGGFLGAGVMVDGAWQQTVAGTPQGGVISPLLANIVLHQLDRAMEGIHGIFVRYADDGVVMCRTRAQAEQALGVVRDILAGMGLALHADKTKVVDLRQGREGFDFLGCHFRARMSGRLWEQKRRRVYYLHRWPAQRSMKRARAKIKALTGRNRCHQDIREIIAMINPILRGWGNYFRTGNAARKFNQLDRYVAWRLRRLMVKRYGRNLHAGRADAWTREWFEAHGLHRLRGTVRYPGAA
ncbi:MAG: group II intron reverse transcriptase/maturase [Egibacteraceae bacterium]